MKIFILSVILICYIIVFCIDFKNNYEDDKNKNDDNICFCGKCFKFYRS